MLAEKINRIQVQTPEGVIFSLFPASPFCRFLGWTVDMLCQISLYLVALKIMGLLSFLGGDLTSALLLILFFTIQIGYSCILEWFWRGQTLGKRLFRLRVMDIHGLRLRPSQIIVRNLLRFVDSIPLLYFLGGVACFLSPRRQRLGDLAANTIVVRTPLVREPDLKQLLSDKFNSFREYPHLAARLRQNVSPVEAGIALRALLRRETLDAAARIRLFQEIANRFRAVVTFPEETTDGLSDEKYVRNAVDILFRTAPE